MTSILAVDVGNSYIKWGLSKDYRWLAKKQVSHKEIQKLSSQWGRLSDINFVVISSVSHQLITKQLSAIINSFNYKTHWIRSRSHQCGITNNYKYHQQLGADRWAALVGAWNKFHQSCLVINVGTAMTVDAISRDGLFLGGYIVPGPYLQLEILVANTQLKHDLTTRDSEVFPTTTSSAMHNGICVALTALIGKAKQLFLKHQGYYPQNCIVSGGGASFIRDHIDFPFIEIDNLVLEGLVFIAHDLLQIELS